MIFRNVFILLLIFCSQSSLAIVTVKTDREQIIVNESFQLIFESDENKEFQPDFSPLTELFTVIDSRRISNSKIIFGKFRYSQQWVFTLFPKNTGKITIPAIQLGNEKTEPKTIEIIPSQSTSINTNQDIFLEVDVNTTEPYVQAQVIYTLKLYRAITTSDSNLSAPTTSNSQAVVKLLDNDNSYEKIINGKRYVVFERQYAVFPQSSGAITIQPVIFSANAGTLSMLHFDIYDYQRSDAIYKQSQVIELNVKPIPETFTGKNWLPAQNVTVEEQWSVEPDNFKQGEAVTRSLVLNAQGLVASNLPAIAQTLPDKFKQYPDQPEFEEMSNSNGALGIRREKIAIIPTEAGEFILPAIQIPWWNTDSNTMEIAQLPEKKITIAATSNMNGQISETEPGTDQTTIADTNNAETDISLSASKPTSIWQWTSIALFALWLTTCLLWFQNNRKSKLLNDEDSDTSETIRQLTKQLKQYCDSHNPHKAKDTLLQWARKVLPDNNINNISDIKQFVSMDFQMQINSLNQHLYSHDSESWNGDLFFKIFNAEKFKQQNKQKTLEQLEPLYR